MLIEAGPLRTPAIFYLVIMAPPETVKESTYLLTGKSVTFDGRATFELKCYPGSVVFCARDTVPLPGDLGSHARFCMRSYQHICMNGSLRAFCVTQVGLRSDPRTSRDKMTSCAVSSLWACRTLTVHTTWCDC